jgi:hypothetical protein
MSNEEIKKKYGIEPIMKEMWVWDYDIKKGARLEFVLFKEVNRDPEYTLLYFTWHKNSTVGINTNVSETNPNEPQEPQVGDIGYFWDFQNAYAYGALIKIYQNQTHKYAACTNSFFINFSKEKQPWMK